MAGAIGIARRPLGAGCRNEQNSCLLSARGHAWGHGDGGGGRTADQGGTEIPRRIRKGGGGQWPGERPRGLPADGLESAGAAIFGCQPSETGSLGGVCRLE